MADVQRRAAHRCQHCHEPCARGNQAGWGASLAQGGGAIMLVVALPRAWQRRHHKPHTGVIAESLMCMLAAVCVVRMLAA